MDIGTGYMVERSIPQAEEHVKGKLAMIQQNLTKTSETIARNQHTLDQINSALQDRMQAEYAKLAQLQEQQQGKDV